MNISIVFSRNSERDPNKGRCRIGSAGAIVMPMRRTRKVDHVVNRCLPAVSWFRGDVHGVGDVAGVLVRDLNPSCCLQERNCQRLQFQKRYRESAIYS